MIFAIATAITKLFGIDFDAATKWARRVVLIVIILVVVLPSAIIYTRCTREKPVSPERVQKIQDAIAKGDREELAKEMAEIDADAATLTEAGADAATEREKAIEESKKKYDGLSAEELQAEAKRRVQENQ